MKRTRDAAGRDLDDRLALYALARRFGLDDVQRERLAAIVDALAAEADPPTTLRSRDEIAEGHVTDSLSALELPAVRDARRIADIGSGAGFPALPLAVALPDARVDAIEASSRKCEVIERLIARAGLSNARAIARRAETWAGTDGREAYDLVAARAVCILPVLSAYAAPLPVLGRTLLP